MRDARARCALLEQMCKFTHIFLVSLLSLLLPHPTGSSIYTTDRFFFSFQLKKGGRGWVVGPVWAGRKAWHFFVCKKPAVSYRFTTNSSVLFKVHTAYIFIHSVHMLFPANLCLFSVKYSMECLHRSSYMWTAPHTHTPRPLHMVTAHGYYFILFLSFIQRQNLLYDETVWRDSLQEPVYCIWWMYTRMWQSTRTSLLYGCTRMCVSLNTVSQCPSTQHNMSVSFLTCIWTFFF